MSPIRNLSALSINSTMSQPQDRNPRVNHFTLNPDQSDEEPFQDTTTDAPANAVDANVNAENTPANASEAPTESNPDDTNVGTTSFDTAVETPATPAAVETPMTPATNLTLDNFFAIMNENSRQMELKMEMQAKESRYQMKLQAEMFQNMMLEQGKRRDREESARDKLEKEREEDRKRQEQEKTENQRQKNVHQAELLKQNKERDEREKAKVLQQQKDREADLQRDKKDREERENIRKALETKHENERFETKLNTLRKDEADLKEKEDSKKERAAELELFRKEKEDSKLERAAELEVFKAMILSKAKANVTPTVVPVGGPPVVLDGRRCSPDHHVWVMHKSPGLIESRVQGVLQDIFWSNKHDETMYSIKLVGVQNPITVEESKIWPFFDDRPGNNKDGKINILGSLAHIPQYNFSPGSTIEYTQNLKTHRGRISEITMDADFDKHDFPDHNFRYTVVDPSNPNCIMETNLTSDNFVSIHIDSYSLQSAQKSISTILLVSAQALSSLSPDHLEKWYTHSRHLLASFNIHLPFWSKLKRNTSYEEFLGENYTAELAQKLFMYFSRTDVIPENILEARNKISKAITPDGYTVIWKILQENHPVFQTAGNNTLWPKYNPSEPVTSFIMSYQAHIAQESKKQRFYGNMEMLANIHCELPTRTFRLTKDKISEILRDFSDDHPTEIPLKWTVERFDTTIKKLTTQFGEDTGRNSDNNRDTNHQRKVYAITDGASDDEDMGGYETCEDDAPASVNYTSSNYRGDSRGRSSNFRGDSRGRSPSRNRPFQNNYNNRGNDRYNNNRNDSQRNRSFSRGSSRSNSRHNYNNDSKSVLLSDIKDYIDAVLTDDLVKKFKYGRDSLTKKVFNKKVDSEQSSTWRQRKGAVRYRPQKNERNNVNVLVHHILDGYHACDESISFDTLDVDTHGNIHLKD